MNHPLRNLRLGAIWPAAMIAALLMFGEEARAAGGSTMAELGDGLDQTASQTGTGTNEIWGRVYDDVDGDGNTQSDWGLAGIPVEVYADPNGNGLADDGLAPMLRAVTDWWGEYFFLGVPDGNVVVVEHDPYGATSTNDAGGFPDDSMVGLSLSGWEVWTWVNFLDTGIEYSNVTGVILLDADGDGVFSPGDEALEDITVEIYEDRNANGVVEPDELLTGITTTDNDGAYGFTGVPNRHYVLVPVSSSGAAILLDTDNSPVNGPGATGILVDGVNLAGNNFLFGTPSISGRVLHDLDGDGDLNDDDHGITGVKVKLYEDTNANGTFEGAQDTLLATTRTDGAGRYLFHGLADGDYIVKEVNPPNSTSTNDWDDAPLQSAGTNNWIAVTINNGGNRSGRNFLDTNVAEGVISGHVRNDTDGDGDLLDNDAGLAGVLVRLYFDPQGSGNLNTADLVAVGVTNANGKYTFPHLIPADYIVQEIDPNGASSTNDTENIGLPLSEEGVDNIIQASAEETGEESGGNDFLDTGAAISTVKGRVLNDADASNDGAIGADDSPIGGVKVKLFRDINGNGLKDANEPRVATTHTGSNGVYEFANLVDGAYVLVETDPSGASSESDVHGDPQDNSIGLVVSGADRNNLDFLDDGIDTHAISGRVTSGGDPVANVVITLKNASGARVDTVLTNSGGFYSFPNLVDGIYTVHETNPAGVTGGSDADGGDPDLITVVLDGTDRTGNDFNDEGVALASISGAVLDDGPGNNNTIGPEDNPVAGVTVNLYLDVNGDGFADGGDTLLLTATTDTDGAYYFGSLQDGDYLVTEINPGSSISDNDADGAANGKDTIAVSLAGGVDSAGNDFLDDFVNNYTISGTVTDQGGAPLQAVIVTLTGPGGALIDEAATATDGTYSFPGIQNGSYLVTETDPDGVVGGSDSDGSANGDNTIAVTVNYGNVPNRNFIDEVPSPPAGFTISGQVRDDADGDGDAAEGGDRPVDGIEVRLYRDADNNGRFQRVERIATAVTCSAGCYSFSGLPNGSYLVSEIDPPGHSTSTGDPGTGDPDLIAVTIAGADSTGNDFLDAIDPAGYFYDSLTGEIVPGGSIEVIPNAFGTPTIVQNGSTGQYSFLVDSADTYTMVITPPPGYLLDNHRPVEAPVMDPTGLPDPTYLGAGEDLANIGYLTDASAGANPYYLVFDLAPGDPFILQNNIPLRTPEPRNFAQFVADHGLSGAAAQPVADATAMGGNPDGDANSNIVEHALCLDPNTGADSHPGFRIAITDPATGRLDASFTRATGISDVIYTLEARDSLTGDGADGQGWFTLASIAAGAPATAPFTVTDNGDGTETVTCPDLAAVAGLNGFGLIRLRVALDADQDGSPDTLPSDGTAVTGSTKTFGWHDCSCNAGQVASLSNPFVNEAVFSGTVDGISGLAVDVSSSAGGIDLRTIITGGGTHYLQVTSGALEGQRFDIGSVGIANLVLINDPDIFSDSDGVVTQNTSDGYPANAELAGASFLVIPHRTIDQLFDKATAFAGQASWDPNLAPRLLVYNNRRDFPGFDPLVLIDNTIEIKWIYAWDLGLQQDQGSTPLPLGDGVYLEPRQGAVNLTAIGVVADYNVAVAFNEGYNTIGAPYPTDQSAAGPNGRGYTIANGFAGGIDPVGATGLLFWDGDEAVDGGTSYAPGYSSFLLLDGGGMQFWTDINDFMLPDLDNTLILKGHRAATLKLPVGNSIRPHVYQQPTP